jgi:hypothetical protein
MLIMVIGALRRSYMVIALPVVAATGTSARWRSGSAGR